MVGWHVPADMVAHAAHRVCLLWTLPIGAALISRRDQLCWRVPCWQARRAALVITNAQTVDESIATSRVCIAQQSWCMMLKPPLVHNCTAMGKFTCHESCRSHHAALYMWICADQSWQDETAKHHITSSILPLPLRDQYYSCCASPKALRFIRQSQPVCKSCVHMSWGHCMAAMQR